MIYFSGIILFALPLLDIILLVFGENVSMNFSFFFIASGRPIVVLIMHARFSWNRRPSVSPLVSHDTSRVWTSEDALFWVGCGGGV